MKDLQYLGTGNGSLVGDLNDLHVVTHADWLAAAALALQQGADPAAVTAALASRETASSELLHMSAVGDVQTIEGTGRMVQDVSKIFLTERGLSPFPNYGTSLGSAVGASVTDPNVLSFVADEAVAAIRYQALIETSSAPEELIGQIKQLDAEFSTNTILLTLQLETTARTEVTLQFEV